MSKTNKRQLIVSLLMAEYIRAQDAYRHAYSKRVGEEASSKAWDECNPMDGIGGFSQNPSNVSILRVREENARIYAEQLKEAYDFAVNTFLDNQQYGGA